MQASPTETIKPKKDAEKRLILTLDKKADFLAGVRIAESVII
jgi:hypothetical protein